jgi:tripartite-type tricarboxylate transporter receptor subunit TctC
MAAARRPILRGVAFGARAGLGALAGFVPVAAPAREYLATPVRLVIPFPQAGTVDPVTRMMGEGLTRAPGQQVVVENKRGANGNIGTTEVVRSAAKIY